MISSADILKASLLIVDDQEANVSLLEEMLRSAGYLSVASTRNPHEVCELHRKNRYSLILLDLQMPGLDGFQVMDALKAIETGGYLPVLAQTSQPGHRLRALKAGAKDFVSKPFDLAEILIRVHNMLEVRLLQLEAEQMKEELRRANQGLDQRVRERTAQLEVANKELEAFSYSVSHDLRAPVRHISGFAGLLQQKLATSLDTKDRKYLAAIAEAAHQMGLLIDALLSLCRMGRVELHASRVNVGEMVREVIAGLGPEIGGRELVWKIDPLPEVQADPDLMRQVWVNLMSNAVKYSRRRAPARIEISSRSGPGEDIFLVRDNGAGFDMKYGHKLFGVFQRLHRVDEFEGTGIGLANVQRIIHRHGGRTWAEGVVDQGATFYFSLPQLTGQSPFGSDASVNGMARPPTALEHLLVNN